MVLNDRDKAIINVTWHGRGGQGAVTAAMILAEAAYLDGYKGVTAAPFFGVERRGAPITATTRFSRTPIRTLTPTAKADVVVVLDERLMQAVDVLGGLKADGLLILNSSNPPEKFCNDMAIAVATSDATSAVALHFYCFIGEQNAHIQGFNYKQVYCRGIMVGSAHSTPPISVFCFLMRPVVKTKYCAQGLDK